MNGDVAGLNPTWRGTGIARAMVACAGAATVTVTALGGAVTWRASDALLLPSKLSAATPLAIESFTPAPGARALQDRFGDHPAYEVRLTGRDAALDGTWGLVWKGGRGVLGSGRVEADDSSARPLLLLEGSLPLSADGGEPAQLCACIWPEEPTGGPRDVRTVTVDGPLGAQPAWVVDAAGADTWLIGVHGRAAPKCQLWRMAVAAGHMGVTTLVPSYRNDPDAPSTGHYELGAGEWADIDAAIGYALANGARRVVVAGLSMGGAIVAKLLNRSAHRDRIAGVVLDSPVLDWSGVLSHVARRLPLGGVLLWPLVPLVLALSARRAGLDRRSLGMLVDPDELDVPVLLVHGDGDPVVPVDGSDALAAARPDLVTYLRVDGGGHVNAWNSDPERYDAVVRDFLARVLRGERAA